MSSDRTRQTRRRRAIIAAVLAVLVHVGLLTSMGLVRPRLGGETDRSGPDLELQLLPQLAASLPPKGSEPVTARAREARRAALAASPVATFVSPGPPPAEVPAPSTQLASSGQDAGGAKPSGLACAPEDLILLTPAEREKCRDQIDVARARAARAMDAAERADRMAAMRRAPRLDPIPADKRERYDAAAAAQAAVRDDFRQPALAAAIANHHGFGPKGSNLDVNVHVHCAMQFGPNAGKATLRCPHDLPTGFLTEEARTNPP